MQAIFRKLPFLLRWRNRARLWRSAWEARGRLRELPPAAEIEEKPYRDYLIDQIAKSQLQAAPRAEVQPRTRHLVGLLAQRLDPQAPKGKVLCIGCRDTREIDEIERQTGYEAVGVDLFSADPRIVAGDFHHLPFGDASFEVVYSCHSLEHAFDLARALAEFTRVLQPSGLWVIEVPISFELSTTDRQDIGTVANLIERLGPALGEVLWQEDHERADGRRKDARLIARKRGST